MSLFAAAALGGCADYVESGGGGNEEGVSVAGEALLGNATYAGCDGPQEDRINAALTAGRIASRSAAFQECLALASADHATRYLASDDDVPADLDFGPYLHCSGEDIDPLPDGNAAQQQARLLSTTATVLPIEMRCGEDCGPKASACTDVPIAQGDSEYIKWKTVPAVSDQSLTAAIIWHEVAHNHGYEHDDCSYLTPAENAKDHSAPNLVGSCIFEILEQSKLSTVCTALACAQGEMALVTRYGQYTGSHACQCVPDVFRDENEEDDRFGDALATADFDFDGFEDLAVGAPGEGDSRGSVYVFRGSEFGLRFLQRLSVPSIVEAVDYSSSPAHRFEPTAAAGDQFGFVLAAGDLNGDSRAELVVGAPGTNSHAGAVYIFGGTPNGLDIANVQFVDQGLAGSIVEPGDRFGAALALGTFDNSGPLDLAVGVPNEVYLGDLSGVVNVFLGNTGSVGASTFIVDDVVLHQELGIWSNDENDLFGYTLAAGNLDSDANAELVIGAPGEDSGVGYVFVANRSSSGWTLPTSVSKTDSIWFGTKLAVGDFIGNSKSDLAIGAPVASAGSVFLFSGSGTTTPSFTYRQTISGNEDLDTFGVSLAVADITGGSKKDLIVGSTGETFDDGPPEGIVRYYAGSTGNTLTQTGSYSQGDTFGVSDDDTVLPREVRGYAHFGAALAVGRFAHVDGQRTVVIGAPWDEVRGVQGGSVFVTADELTTDGRKLDQETMTYGEGWRTN